MRTWRRAAQPMPCGGPHDQLVTIPVGAPLLVITMERVRALYRCELCAGEPVPVLPGEAPQPTGFTRVEQALAQGIFTREEAAQFLRKYGLPLTPASKVYQGQRIEQQRLI